MREYKCLCCEYRFSSEDEIPYCPSCQCENLEEIEEELFMGYEVNRCMESHHIHPRFMGNPKGKGQQYMITKKQHDILHGYIMKWIWDEVPEKEKERITNIIISKSKDFIGVKDGKL